MAWVAAARPPAGPATVSSTSGGLVSSHQSAIQQSQLPRSAVAHPVMAPCRRPSGVDRPGGQGRGRPEGCGCAVPAGHAPHLRVCGGPARRPAQGVSPAPRDRLPAQARWDSRHLEHVVVPPATCAKVSARWWQAWWKRRATGRPGSVISSSPVWPKTYRAGRLPCSACSLLVAACQPRSGAAGA